ncbi:MAG: ISAzo13-like element transposase-related protein [Acidimicrobiales bacterium]
MLAPVAFVLAPATTGAVSSVAITSLRTVIELISATTTKTGLKIRAADDSNWYPTGVKISDAELAEVLLIPHDRHGDWNYTLSAQSVVA